MASGFLGLGFDVDPDLLTQDDEKSDKSDQGGESDESGEEDKYDTYDKYDDMYELGRTPPRQVMSMNRKWSDNKKHMREMQMGKSTEPLSDRMDDGEPMAGEELAMEWTDDNHAKGGVTKQQLLAPQVTPKKVKNNQKRRGLIQSQKLLSITRANRGIILEDLTDTNGGGGGGGGRGGWNRVDSGNKEEENYEDQGYLRYSTMSLGPHSQWARSGTMSLVPQSLMMPQPAALPQADSLPMGSYRVETTNRFMSLSSRPVQVPSSTQDEHSLSNSGSTTPRKRSSITNQDRQTFYRLLGAMVKSQKKKERDSIGDPYGRQQSREETLWQNELKEVIWLELQAWFAGRDVNKQDELLMLLRKSIEPTAMVVTQYRFEGCNGPWKDDKTTSRKSHNSDDSDYFDAEETLKVCESDSHLSLSMLKLSLDSSVGDSSMASMPSMASMTSMSTMSSCCQPAGECEAGDGGDQMEGCEPVADLDTVDGAGLAKSVAHDHDNTDSLEVFCQYRIANTNKALRQVQQILNDMEKCQDLFPSSRLLAQAYPSWADKLFRTRVKVLCMWYNLTLALHRKIDMLGRLLLGLMTPLGAVPWPRFDEPSTPTVDEGLGDNDIDSVLSPRDGTREAAGGPHLINATIPPPENIFSRENSDYSLQTPGSPATQPMPGAIANQLTVNQESKAATSPHKVRFNVLDDPSDCISSPSDSTNSSRSTDSGAGSTSTANHLPTYKRKDSTLSTTSLNSSVISDNGSFLEGTCTSIYRKYVEKHLKTKGIRRTLSQLHRVIRGPLHRAKIALERPGPSTLVEGTGSDYHPHLVENTTVNPNPSEDDQELAQFGTWNPQFQAMNLPSFRATYLFLCRVPRDIIQECLKIRLEQKPLEPSELSIRQLMRECKEVLRLAVVEREKYISRVKAAISDAEKDKDFLATFEQEMEEFDSDLTKTLDVYLEYLGNFVTMIQEDSSFMVYQKNLLEEEWGFIKMTCPHIPGGEARAGNAFCRMACGMLGAIGEFLHTGTDEIVGNVQNTLTDMIEDTEETFERKLLFEAFRNFQTLFLATRERSVKAIAFAKLLRKDLEVCAEFSLTQNPMRLVGDDLLGRLHETGHVQVITPNAVKQMVFIPNSIKNSPDAILQLLDMHCGQDTGMKDDNTGYLVLISQNVSANLVWHGETINVKPTAETTKSLSQTEVSGVLLVALSAALLESKTREFSKCMKEVIVLEKEQRAANLENAQSLKKVKVDALQLRTTISEELSKIQQKCDINTYDPAVLECLDQGDVDTLTRRMREILHQCYKFGFEYHKEVDRLITGSSSRCSLAYGVINFAKQWMKFVMGYCEKGRGLKPDWASKGMEFLFLAADPKFTKCLNDEEFLDFKSLTENCHKHVIGEKETPERRSSISPSGNRSYSRSNSRSNSPRRQISSETRDENLRHKLSDKNMMPPPASPMGTLRKRNESRKSLTGDDENDSLIFRVPSYANLPWKERVKQSIQHLEGERQEYKKQNQMIGSVLEKTQPEDRIQVKAKLVKFSWQRGVKIGEGSFGKVYTAINNETGETMAMKEYQLQPNDHKMMRNVADELRIFESIHHPNLINHFGVEIHREEMLIFMEYCPEGTLEALVTSTENGLEESLVRRYTNQILKAVACLHENKIVHRDIKGANIFLTDDMQNLKLGDFGCATKIKSHTTMAGELKELVGTQAFMAPEVFTRNNKEGHGRAADIWSVGCVVIEMATGERPWSDLVSAHQIMFKVGMGFSPATPERLTEEGKDFLAKCLVHNPENRSTAEELLGHPFTKVSYILDDENPSMPLFTSIADLSDMRKALVRKDSGKY